MSTTYFANLHEESLALLIEARDYMKDMRNRDQGAATRDADNDDCLESLETMRLTSRLTQVMAWMLAQRAISSGAITVEEGASERFSLSGQSVCLEHDPSKTNHLPTQLRGLLQRSYDLYRRVVRLEAQICGRFGEGEPLQIWDPKARTFNVLPLKPSKTSDQGPRSAY